MAYDGYLQLDGIKGDSKDDKHKDWIAIQAFSHGITQAYGGASVAHGGHAGGRADFSDIVVTKRLDLSSPLLHLYCVEGKNIPKCVFELCRAAGDKKIFMRVTLEDAIVSSIQSTGSITSDDVVPTETINLRFKTIQWEYTPIDEKNQAGAAVKSGWDLAAWKKK
jgi:type VI secretion system secreted protein Hcp